MKGLTAILACAFALAQGGSLLVDPSEVPCTCNEAQQICDSHYGADDVLIAHAYCNKFYKCSNGLPIPHDCPSILLYNPVDKVCDWPQNVDCGGRPIAEGQVEEDCSLGGSDNNGSNDNTNDGNGNLGGGDNQEIGGNDNDQNEGSCNCNPGEAPSICEADGSDGTLVAHENCNQFYKCDHGKPVALWCPGSLLYNPHLEVCDWPESVDCGDRPIAENEDCDEDLPANDQNGNDNGAGDNNESGNNPGTCNCNPGEAPSICQADGSDGTLVAHENCNQFYKCDHGKPVALWCPGSLLYNPHLEVCDWPESVDCGDRPIAENEDCDEDLPANDQNGNDNGAGDNNESGNNPGTCNCNPGEAPSICQADGSDGTLVAHENCNQFYKCDHGKPVALWCPGSLLYNPHLEVCDWPESVDCGDRPIAENEDCDEDLPANDQNGNDNGAGDNNETGNNPGTCNCNPGEAPSICQADGSDGTLVAHENCNQFYKCDHGKPVALWCPGSLLYNPHLEVCDWPESVDCGDRPIAENEDSDEDLPANDQNGNDNGAGDNNENGNNPGTCNCNPGEAPSICQADGSDGTLVAHENCNQFYKCDHGKPVALWCPGSLLYNPHLEVCDWPESVDCGDRPIAENEDCDEDLPANDQNGNDNGAGDNNETGNNPGTCNCNPGEAPSICQADGSDGTLVAHENCNQFYKCDHGKPVALWCPGSLLYNPHLEVCDWPESVDCGDRPIAENEDCDEDLPANDQNGNDNGAGDNNESGNNPGTCNCNPGEAPSICQADGSDGTLVAHENCNQFYKCDHGKPVALWCPGSLLYNPHLEVCDWPESVDCGDRPIAENEDSDEDLPANDQNGNDNGAGDNNENGNNPGTCNCNPGEAPSICQADGSDGTLVAHENCNQFYKCDHGKPVALWCPGSLLYNPHLEVCDWPESVDCGDRPIAENEDCDEDLPANDQNGNDNGAGDNNENGNNPGTCNCNPGEAPTICQVNGSDGTLIAHENCNQFYKCDHGKPVAFWCSGGLVYNPYLERCDWPQNVDCEGRPIAENEDSDEDLPANDQNGNDNGAGDNNENGNNPGTCNCNPGEAPTICQVNGSDGTLIAHENCNQFYKCDHGKPVAFWCSGGLVYNPYLERCDWPQNVDCEGRPIAENEDSDEDLPANDQNGNDNGAGDNNENGNNPGTCNCNPGEAPTICQVNGSDGTLIAHENCNQFYKCDHGKPVAFWCSGGLVYNPYLERCDWPQNVDCEGRPIAENEDSDEDLPANDQNGNDNGAGDNNENGNNPGTCNCNPGEAPTICQVNGSDGILIAHENCNQFYKCDHGKPVAFWCSGGLVYNPYLERCDWPQNVDCEGRPIAENEDSDEDLPANDQNGNDNGAGDNNENGNNPGTCNCNPGEAPTICQVNGSDGTLIAHENCNQFYKCDHGKPVAFWCSGGLVYNPYLERCDWPQNVDCGDKPIAEIEDCEDDETDNNQNGNGGGNGDNNDNENGNNPGTCNCNPGEAPTICQVNGSDGTLIAHENCNQFYKCDHGKPVAFWCSGGLVYNPYLERCDWPQNVDCEGRPIAENEDCDEDLPANDQNGNDNGAGDNNENGNNPGTCNCNPGEAPSICQADGSDGTLVAHENCNQFYKCDHGKPVALWCPGSLLYNPHLQICDWPDNVDCGDRPIVENEDNSDSSSDSSSESSSESSSGSGSGDNGNNNEGSCNCNPQEAPEICANENSGGILIAHENCDKFYKCDNGKPVEFNCPSGLLYDPYNEICDWAANVNCGDRDISEDDSVNDDSNEGNNNDNESTGSGNCDPSQAPTICQASDSNGILVAHENCDQFYLCAGGIPVAISCNENLLFNPLIDQCDWPSNVDCGDRIVPGVDDSSNGDGQNNENASDPDDNLANDPDDNLANDPDDNLNNDSESGVDNGNNGSNCNCRPEEAPAICAADESGGELIAHEDCDKFYMCALGTPVVLVCSSNLLYNPYTKQCDWPANVVCGDRVIPEADGSNDSNSDQNDTGNDDVDSGNENGNVNDDPSQAPGICGNSGSDGTLVAHPNCDQFYMCSGGLPVELHCSENLLYNPVIQQCDWAREVDCGDRVVPESEDNSVCSCNPRNAPVLCARDGSDGTLVAHENCNMFYMCAHGVPVPYNCAASLSYNTDIQVCDWPQNVDCGARLTTHSFNKFDKEIRNAFKK